MARQRPMTPAALKRLESAMSGDSGMVTVRVSDLHMLLGNYERLKKVNGLDWPSKAEFARSYD